MCHLALSINVNIDVWKSLKVFKKCIKIENLNQEQLQELGSLSAYVNKLIVENFARNTISNIICRFQYGYYFNRRCTMKSSCTNWSIKLNIQMKTIDIWLNKKCPHKINLKIEAGLGEPIFRQEISNEASRARPNDDIGSGRRIYFSCKIILL